MTLINTNGMAFFGPGSEWFWAALQFTALAITFIAIYRQFRIARSARAFEQVAAYTRQFEEERMYRDQVAILVAMREGTAIPRAAAIKVSNYFETLGSLSRRGHLDVKLLWSLFTLVTGIWWTVLQPFVQQERARSGDAISEDFEWLVGVMAKMDRQAGAVVLIDAAYVANWLAVGAIESLEDNIRIEQSLRTVTITTSDRLDTAQSLGAAPNSGASNCSWPDG